jgi:hypothetical protein
MGSEGASSITYDRQLLLLGSKRNVMLELWEVLRYGIDSYGDAGYVSIYGLPPAEWYGQGIRLLGRTAVECTRDQLADAIGQQIAATAKSGPRTPRTVIVDPFVGSGNTLYWIMRHLPHAVGVGYEVDPQVFELTKRNLSILGLPLEVQHADYAKALEELSVPADALLIAFIAPPWGSALSTSDGLDLRRTLPPVSEIIDRLAERFGNPMLCAIQVYERIVPASIAELTVRFDWSAVRMYDFNAAGQNHGVLLATRGWRPSTPSRTHVHRPARDV